MTLRYFDGCPNWRTTLGRLRGALREAGKANVEPVLELVDTIEEAERLRFVGSPTLLLDGRDPFAKGGGTFGLSCRIHQTPDGPSGSPTKEQLLDAIRTA